MLMKRIRTICVALCALFGFGVMNAQVMDASKIAVAEPEFDMDALLLLNETEAVPLQIELYIQAESSPASSGRTAFLRNRFRPG